MFKWRRRALTTGKPFCTTIKIVNVRMNVIFLKINSRFLVTSIIIIDARYNYCNEHF